MLMRVGLEFAHAQKLFTFFCTCAVTQLFGIACVEVCLLSSVHAGSQRPMQLENMYTYACAVTSVCPCAGQAKDHSEWFHVIMSRAMQCQATCIDLKQNHMANCRRRWLEAQTYHWMITWLDQETRQRRNI